MSSLAIETDELEAPDEGLAAPQSELESNEPEMESYLHLSQLLLLLQCLELHWKERKDFFAAGNMSIYFSEKQLSKERMRGPDFFVVLGTERRPRKSWCVWKEDGKYPNFILEVLSTRTSALDRGLKKQVYQDVFRTPDYFWFDPESKEFAGFHAVDGQYQPLPKDAHGRMHSAQLGLLLGVHEGMVRFFTEQGEILPSAPELSERNEKLAAKLRELGIDPNSLP